MRDEHKAQAQRYAKMIELLLAARKRIKNQDSIFVCSAIGSSNSRKFNGKYAHEEKALKIWIARQLQGCAMASGWLYENGVEESDLTTDNMRKWRLAWIDHMIKILES